MVTAHFESYTCKVVLLLCILLISNCEEKDSDPAPVNIKLLSLTVDGSYTLDKDHWVFINDVNGALLDSRKLETEGIVTFETSDPVPEDKISITIFSDNSSASGKSYLFSSYTSVPTGDAWTLRTPPVTTSPNAGAKTGSFTVAYVLPTPTTMDIFGSGFSLGQYNLSGNTKYHTMDIFEKNKNFLLSVAGDGNPRYWFFENAMNGDTYELSFNEMNEFDHILDISFPTANDPYANVIAFDEDGLNHYYAYHNGYNLPPFAESTTSTRLRIGYLNRFQKYYTIIQLPLADFFFSYTKQGGVPGPIIVPDKPYFEILDNSFSGFSYSSEKAFSSRRSTFRDATAPENTSVSWVVRAPEGTDKIMVLPDDLLAKYPFIGIGKFNHVSSTFSISNTTYMDEIGRLFKGESSPEEFEVTEFTVR